MDPHAHLDALARNRRHVQAIVLMLVAVALFSLMDSGLKVLSTHYPAFQVATIRGLASLPLVLAWALATLLWIVVLSRAPLSYVYVLGSLNYLLVPLLSRWLFAEPMAPGQMLGMVIIAIGVLVTLAGRAGTSGGA